MRCHGRLYSVRTYCSGGSEGRASTIRRQCHSEICNPNAVQSSLRSNGPWTCHRGVEPQNIGAPPDSRHLHHVARQAAAVGLEYSHGCAWVSRGSKVPKVRSIRHRTGSKHCMPMKLTNRPNLNRAARRTQQPEEDQCPLRVLSLCKGCSTSMIGLGRSAAGWSSASQASAWNIRSEQRRGTSSQGKTQRNPT